MTLLLTLTPLAAGWYVLLLSLLGVALGFYFQRSPLRAAQGRRGCRTSRRALLRAV
ncbi:hypothetical protein O0544_04155 [Edwardsiella anguillarum]|nr:hypothetical protein [Edwardsiella anguillarum]